MLLLERILGDRHEEAFHHLLHDLEHDGLVEYVTIGTADMDRHRLRARTDRGEEVAVALPRDQKLFDGAVLMIGEGRAIVVHSDEQHWLRVRPHAAADALELGYHAGNLHWRVRFEGTDLLVALEGQADIYKARIAPLIAAGRVTVSEEVE
jgi:urease accessory protein